MYSRHRLWGGLSLKHKYEILCIAHKVFHTGICLTRYERVNLMSTSVSRVPAWPLKFRLSLVSKQGRWVASCDIQIAVGLEQKCFSTYSVMRHRLWGGLSLKHKYEILCIAHKVFHTGICLTRYERVNLMSTSVSRVPAWPLKFRLSLVSKQGRWVASCDIQIAVGLEQKCFSTYSVLPT